MSKPAIILIFFILAGFLPVLAQEDPSDNIMKAIQDSDARQLATYFNSSVDLRIAGIDNSYSQSQGEMVMKDFFKKSPASSFTLSQKGTTDSSTRFAIGDYQSGVKLYQVYIQLRLSQGKYLIQQLRFEEKKSTSSPQHEH